MKSNLIKIEINDREFQVKSHAAGEVSGFPNSPNDDGPHYRHRVFVTERGISKSFMFYGSINDYYEGKQRLDEQDLIHAFDSFLSDAIAGDMCLEDFIAEFGYTEDLGSGRATRIHLACQKSLDKINDFGIFTSEVYDLANELREVYEV